LEQTLERFRRDLLTRSAEDYRNDSGAMASLTDGLNRLRENAVQLARSDAREVISRFGQMGGRSLCSCRAVGICSWRTDSAICTSHAQRSEDQERHPRQWSRGQPW
jgi:hypothetical protein